MATTKGENNKTLRSTVKQHVTSVRNRVTKAKKPIFASAVFLAGIVIVGETFAKEFASDTYKAATEFDYSLLCPPLACATPAEAKPASGNIGTTRTLKVKRPAHVYIGV